MYLVTEQQLKQFIIDDIDYNCPDKCIKEFLKSKQPVTEVASGEVGFPEPFYKNTLFIGNATFNGIVREIIEEKYTGKQIKIYVEVINEP
jgi:hypothetical protein